LQRAGNDDGRRGSRTRRLGRTARGSVVDDLNQAEAFARSAKAFALQYLNMTDTTLLDRIRSRQANVGVIGLGYVGLPLAGEFAGGGFGVTGFDVDPAKVAAINRGHSYIPDVAQAELEQVVKSGHLRATTDSGELAKMDVADICVPTPLRKTKDPDLSY